MRPADEFGELERELRERREIPSAETAARLDARARERWLGRAVRPMSPKLMGALAGAGAAAAVVVALLVAGGEEEKRGVALESDGPPAGPPPSSRSPAPNLPPPVTRPERERSREPSRGSERARRRAPSTKRRERSAAQGETGAGVGGPVETGGEPKPDRREVAFRVVLETEPAPPADRAPVPPGAAPEGAPAPEPVPRGESQTGTSLSVGRRRRGTALVLDYTTSSTVGARISLRRGQDRYTARARLRPESGRVELPAGRVPAGRYALRVEAGGSVLRREVVISPA